MNNLFKIATLLAITTVFATAPAQQTTAADMKPTMMMAMLPEGAKLSTNVFKGIEVNGGTATISRENGKTILKLSSNFTIPKTPAPHFQVVDTHGNVFLLKQLKIAGGKTNREVVIPAYIGDVAKVQIWCSFAEVVLGEASFAEAVSLK